MTTVYENNSPIKVVYQPLGGTTGITDLRMIVTDPSGNDSAPVNLSELSGAIYESEFTPDELGRWWVKIFSINYPENSIKESYYVGDGLNNIFTSIINGNEPYKGKYISEKVKNSGSSDMDVDGSVTPVEFMAGPGTGKKWYIARMILTIEDESINHIKFGGLAIPLTNGVDIKITEDGVERTLAEGLIKTNHEFYQLAYDVTIKSATTDILAMRWTFTKGGTFLRFKNSTSDKFSIIINDDLSALQAFQVIIQGYEVDE